MEIHELVRGAAFYGTTPHNLSSYTINNIVWQLLYIHDERNYKRFRDVYHENGMKLD